MWQDRVQETEENARGPAKLSYCYDAFSLQVVQIVRDNNIVSCDVVCRLRYGTWCLGLFAGDSTMSLLLSVDQLSRRLTPHVYCHFAEGMTNYFVLHIE